MNTANDSVSVAEGEGVRANEWAATAAVLVAATAAVALAMHLWIPALPLIAAAVALCALAGVLSRGDEDDLWPARAPGWLFHAFLIPPTLIVWGSSGFAFTDLQLVALAVLAIAAVVWAVRCLVALFARRPWSWWYVVAPACGAVVAKLDLFTHGLD